MPTTSGNIDWSATAAWIALAISIVGTILSPIITTILTNRYQLKLRKMDIQQRTVETYETNRFTAINAFISKSGKCLFYTDDSSVKELGSVFHCVYQYVPNDYWPVLDNFYLLLISHDWKSAKQEYPEIIHKLSKISKETPPTTP